MLYDEFKADLDDKIQRLEEERTEVDIDASLWFERNSKLISRGRGRRSSHLGQEPPKRKPVTTSGPYVVHMLKEQEILEDWTKVKKILLASRRKVNVDQQFKPYRLSQ